MNSFPLSLAAGDILHLWLRPTGEAPAEVRIANTVLSLGASDDFQRIAHVATGAETEASWSEGTEVSVAYAYSPAAPGIRLLHVAPRNRANPHRYQLHLAPPFGWMNDPNGLIEIAGQTHLFYQHYPHALRWNTMHWGHATSANLVDWTHLPVFLHPRPEMLAQDALKGGAFSGTAVATPEGLRVFHTDRQDGRAEQEWQMTALSSDLIEAGPSTPVIDSRPPLPGFGTDLRDPYVFKGPDGLWKMLLGGADAQAALVILYESAALTEGWTYAGILHAEPLDKPVPAECPCLIEVAPGLWTLVFGLVGQQTPVRGKLNPSLCLTGTFDGKSFVETQRRELDFIGDAYAFQTFQHQGRPLGIAWAANWAYVGRGHDFPSCMGFPRRLDWQGELLLPPIEALSALRLEEIAADAPLPPLAELQLRFGAQGFRLELDHPETPVQLTYQDGLLELTGTWARPRARSVRHTVETAEIHALQIFLDIGLIEISVDGGRLNGTKRLDTDKPFTALRLTAPGAETRIWRLRPAHGKEQAHGHR
jgi:beta-fructofuranosidase